MYIGRLIKCEDCGDIFKTVYDSHKEKQEEYKCKCGKLIGRLDYYGSFIYNRNGNCGVIPEDLKDKENNCKWYDDDYIKLTKQEEELIEEINDIAKDIKSYDYENYTDETNIDMNISDVNRYDEVTTISLNISLCSRKGWNTESSIEQHNRLLEGLNNFKRVILMLKNNEISLKDPKTLWKDNTLNLEGDREQFQRYNYEFHC